MTNKSIYKRVLLKLSGEALAGDKKTGHDFTVISKVCEVIKTSVQMGVEIGIVVGGGNMWRGAQYAGTKIDRTRSDHIGMMATVINSLVLADSLAQIGVKAVVQTALDIQAVAEPFNKFKADEHFKSGTVVIFACGTGSPYFSTDTAAVLRAAEINAETILLAKNIDGVYTADPKLDPDAVKLDHITYDEILAAKLNVMDLTATSLAMNNNIPILVFALHDPKNIIRVLSGEHIGTQVR